MANWNVSEISLTNSYEAVKTSEHQRQFIFFEPSTSPDSYEVMKTSKHQRPLMFLKPTTAPEVYPVSTPDFAFATPYSNGSSNTDLAAKGTNSQGEPYKDYGVKLTGSMDEEELLKLKKRLQNNESARKSKLRKKLEIEELQAKVKTLRGETSMLSKDIMRYSHEILELSSENKDLLKELRHMCDQETLSRLESMDPENSNQIQHAPYESNQSSVGEPCSD